MRERERDRESERERKRERESEREREKEREVVIPKSCKRCFMNKSMYENDKERIALILIYYSKEYHV